MYNNYDGRVYNIFPETTLILMRWTFINLIRKIFSFFSLVAYSTGLHWSCAALSVENMARVDFWTTQIGGLGSDELCARSLWKWPFGYTYSVNNTCCGWLYSGWVGWRPLIIDYL